MKRHTGKTVKWTGYDTTCMVHVRHTGLPGVVWPSLLGRPHPNKDRAGTQHPGPVFAGLKVSSVLMQRKLERENDTSLSVFVRYWIEHSNFFFGCNWQPRACTSLHGAGRQPYAENFQIGSNLELAQTGGLSLSAHTEQQSDGEGAWEAPATLDLLPTEQPAYSNTCTLPQNRDGIKGRETFTRPDLLGILLFTLPQNNLPPSLCICAACRASREPPIKGNFLFLSAAE